MSERENVSTTSVKDVPESEARFFHGSINGNTRLGDRAIEAARQLKEVVSDDELQAIYHLRRDADDAEIAMLEDDFARPAIEDDERNVGYHETEKKVGLFRRLGRSALALPSKINEQYYAGIATVIGALPGTKSKEEIIERDRERQEKYAVHEDDGAWTRTKKLVGRNAMKAAAWTPVAFMGVIGASSLARPVVQGAIEAVPVEHLPFVNAMKSTDIWVGGRGDFEAHGIMDLAKRDGVYDEHANNVRIKYPAGIIRATDGSSFNQSNSIATRGIVNAYHEAAANGNQEINIHAFSQGSGGTVDALWEIANAPGNNGRVPDNVKVFIDGGPYGPNGFGNSKWAGIAEPALNMMDIDLKKGIPPGTQVYVRTYRADMWGNGGNQSPLTTGAMAMALMDPKSGVHDTIAPGSPIISRENINGVWYEVYGYPDGVQSALGRVAVGNGMHVTPKGDAFLESLAPISENGVPEYANAREVTATLGPALDEMTGNTGIANNVTDAVMTPERQGDLQVLLDTQRAADDFAAGNLPAGMERINDTMGVVTKWMDPGQWGRAIDDGLKGAGLPPMASNFLQSSPNSAPAWTPPVETPAPAWTPPAPQLPPPVPGAAPAPAGDPAALINQGMNMFNQFMSGFGQRR